MHKAHGRKVIGTSDHPFSLYEGMAGDLVFMAEILQDDWSKARYPGYEIMF